MHSSDHFDWFDRDWFFMQDPTSHSFEVSIYVFLRRRRN